MHAPRHTAGRGLLLGLAGAALLLGPAAGPAEGAARSTKVVLVNRTGQALQRASHSLAHGIWKKLPPKTIGANKKVEWESESSGIATGTEGRAAFRMAGTYGLVQLHWNNPYAGGNSYDEEAPFGYQISNTGGSGNNTRVVFTLEPLVIPRLAKMTISKLAVRVKTSNQHLAGTDNKVYFDIGPLGWELPRGKGVRDRGSDNTHPLAIPRGLRLTTDDIVRLRLHKKGVGGVTGTTDGLDGEWKPESVRVLVNGKEWVRFKVNQWLKKDHPTWMVRLRPAYPAEEQFARTLRLVPNEKLGKGDETVALLTTKFAKEQGISGWLGTRLPLTCATGRVVRTPGLSTDGLATIDLRLESLEVGKKTFNLDGKHGISGPRYLRVEYKCLIPGTARSMHPVPRNGQRVRICGKVMWDTDHEGWYEIHPRGPGDVKALK